MDASDFQKSIAVAWLGGGEFDCSAHGGAGRVFRKKIRPVLAEHCYECHNSSGKEKGGLALDWAGGLAVVGDSGSLLGKGDPRRVFCCR